MMFSAAQAPYTIAAACFMTAQPILTAYSRNSTGSYDYSAGSSLACSEVIKLLISTALLIHTLVTAKSSGKTIKVLDDNPCKEYAFYSVPSFIYFVTNNLQFIILQALSPTTAQLLAQLKTIFTGILFRVMLSRRLSAFQWLALMTLACGTACSQIPSGAGHFLFLSDSISHSSHPVNWLHPISPNSATSLFVFSPSSYAAVGLVASVIAALLSSLAGVYNEKLMKGRFSAPIHWQNIQMYTWGVIMNTIYAFIIDGEAIRQHGFFAGYDWRTWMVVFANAMTGLVISGVLKFCDNIARVYASAIAMIITLFLSVPLFHSIITPQIVISFFLVVISTLQFNLSEEAADKFDRPEGYGKEKEGEGGEAAKQV